MTASQQPIKNSGDTGRSTNRILITGACGFIGSHLTDRLMENPNNEVIAVDNCFSGDKRNLLKWFGNPRFEFIRHDVCLPLTLEVDQIYHLACPASPVFYQYNPIKTVKTAFQGTMNMCGLAKRVNARILLASTSEIYGDPLVHPQVESYFGNVNTIGIRSCYDEGKRISETICFEYHRLHKTDIRVARIFNTFGPRMLENDGRVVSNFIVQALQGVPLTVYGDGSQTRSFCYVDDMVSGLIALMKGDDIGPVNLGNPGEYTIKELAEKIQHMVNPSVNVVYQPLPSDDPTRRRPDITRAKNSLDWEPKIPLDEGLKRTINDFKSRVKFTEKK